MSQKILTVASLGLNCQLVEVEAHIGQALPKHTIVGLADTAVREAKERVAAACDNSGFRFPRTKVTINLAPADVRKEGNSFDLPIALSVLLRQELLVFEEPDADALFVGELSLMGEVRPIRGSVNIAAFAKAKKIKRLYLPAANALEASLIKGLEIYPVNHLSELVEHLTGQRPIKKFRKKSVPPAATTGDSHDLADIQGQEIGKRVLEIAAAGGHNVIFSGPPGAGTTLLAYSTTSLLPALTIIERY